MGFESPNIKCHQRITDPSNNEFTIESPVRNRSRNARGRKKFFTIRDSLDSKEPNTIGRKKEMNENKLLAQSDDVEICFYQEKDID